MSGRITMRTVEEAMVIYHRQFDNGKYTAVADLVASNLRTDRESPRVASLMERLQEAALEVCIHPQKEGMCQDLAVACADNFLSHNTIDAMREFLQKFYPQEKNLAWSVIARDRIDNFEYIAKGMSRAYTGLEEVRSAAVFANGITNWRGRMAYDLLCAAEYIIRAAINLLAQHDESYGSEKLRTAMARLTGALYEGVRHSNTPHLWDMHSVYFPTQEDGNPNRVSKNNR